MKKNFIIFGIIFLVFLTLAICVRQAFFRPAGKSVRFSVKSGEGTREIAHNLKEEGLISSPFLFSLYIYQRHWLMQPGVYQINQEMTTLQIASLIKEGNVTEYLVTVPEGWRLTQIDEYLSQKAIIQEGELIRIASQDEGRLFPDTYRFSLDINSERIRQEMIENFNKKTANLPSQKKVTEDILIIASIVEREAKFDEDRPKIAQVYLNRLKNGMKLEADPTVQYAKGSWDPITSADYRNVDSPYNTYLHEGLPPGPICNPGLKSIEATLFPEQGDYLYFFHKEDGHAVYSKTIEEHTENLKNN